MAQYTSQNNVRSRSIDVHAPPGTETIDLLKLVGEKQPLEPFQAHIEAIFQIGREMFNITVRDGKNSDGIKKQILEQYKNGIRTQKGVLRFEMPKPPNVRINIRAIPVEIPDEAVKLTLGKYRVGNILRVERIYHRGTRILNGYRTITIENYQSNRLPQFVRFEGVNCKIFFPAEEFATIKTCRKCLEKGHEAKDCINDTVCLHCRKTGHRREDCAQKETDLHLHKMTYNNVVKRNLMQTDSTHISEQVQQEVETSLFGSPSSSSDSDLKTVSSQEIKKGGETLQTDENEENTNSKKLEINLEYIKTSTPTKGVDKGNGSNIDPPPPLERKESPILQGKRPHHESSSEEGIAKNNNKQRKEDNRKG